MFLLFRIYESILDDSTLIELKKSKHRFPEITDVVYDINQFQELVLDSINVVEKGFNVIWDKTVFNFHFTYLQDGFKQLETLIEEKHLRVRLIIEATQENINHLHENDLTEEEKAMKAKAEADSTAEADAQATNTETDKK